MLTLPSEYLTLIETFAPVFSARVWRHVQTLLAGAILAPGKRTVRWVIRQHSRRWSSRCRRLAKNLMHTRAPRVRLNLRCKRLTATLRAHLGVRKKPRTLMSRSIPWPFCRPRARSARRARGQRPHGDGRLFTSCFLCLWVPILMRLKECF